MSVQSMCVRACLCVCVWRFMFGRGVCLIVCMGVVCVCMGVACVCVCVVCVAPFAKVAMCCMQTRSLRGQI